MDTTTTKRELWEQIIAAWESSGLSQKAFCQEHGHSHYQFGYWRKKTRASGTAWIDATSRSKPAIQFACYQIGVPANAIDPEPELETQGIIVPVGNGGTVTITGRLTIGQLAKIMEACAASEPTQSREKGASYAQA
jgi:hypothetical protein